ncbi:glycosyltransferase family 9 protein [Dyadobacter subterraneus]|uniref:Glycosyltransferase family 9 protein n=1 Tax=Dyadobacter subterraneus TaxID=2773304 RepID=A0ABR9WJA1_9BACT|nr:glycosyltransferase family 9 protein [Dyadobacter subterraneus]MBE9464239.1 glycosyltransferase family 9 protein [Dyadobacter subterraneus]
MKFKPENVKKIAVFRALQLGDMLCAVPAFRALRQAYPTAQITLLGLPWASSFVSRFSKYFDSFIWFPGYPGLPEQTFDLDDWDIFVQKIEEENFDLILQMQGNGSIVNEMLEQVTRSTLAGFHSPGNFLGAEYFLQYPVGISEIDRHLALMHHLEIPSQGKYLEFPVSSTEEQNLARLKMDIEPHKYICVHPGSRGAWRQWPPAFFAALADECSRKGYQIVVTGTKDEAEITREVIAHMQTKAIDLTGKTGLGEVAVLIRDAYMLISNCTGVSHIASAMETPSIVISMDGEPERWAPLNRHLHRTIDWTKEENFGIVKQEMENLQEMLLSNR